MRRSSLSVRLVVTMVLCMQACGVLAGKVILNIRVVNPSNQPQTRVISQHLPPGLGTNDILSLDGMELRFDSASTSYLVHAEQELGPKQSVSFEVEVNDVWTIPGAELDQLGIHAQELRKLIDGTANAGRGVVLEASITNSLSQIAISQAENEATRVGAERHIDVFARDSRRLSGIRSLLAEMEDMVVGTGRNLDGITFLPGGRGAVAGSNDSIGSVVFRIFVVNMSSNESQSVMAYLPPEIGITDVIDAGVLHVRRDVEKGACCVYKDDVAVMPNESASFEVLIRDKWNVNGGRIERLRRRIMSTWERSKTAKQAGLIGPQLVDIVDALKSVTDRRGPETLDRDYIGFYRDQTKSLARIEEALDRIERILPREGSAPPARYAWVAIYGVVAFLLLFGAAVFLRAARK